MKRLLLLALLTVSMPAAAQSMDQSMPGMDMGSDPHARHHMPESSPTTNSVPHAGHEPAQADSVAVTTGSGTDLLPGKMPAPAIAHDRSAERFHDTAAMAETEHALLGGYGGGYYQILFNLAEYQARKGKDGYRWEGSAWFGGDLDRLMLRTQGEGTFGKSVDSAEIQALYSRAITPWWNLQAGVRHDFQPSPSRTYAVVGVEGLAPYMFDLQGALFLSDKGDLLARLEGSYDQRVTQRLILQPRLELNFAAQDMPANRIGSGLSDAELGVRLRYEIVREFAPYVGVSWNWKAGKTADYARADGNEATEHSLVVGIRTWF